MPNNPPPPGPPQMVTLVPTGTGPNVTWMVQQNGQPPENPGQAKIRLEPGVGPTKFTVNIAGNPAGIKFRETGALSVWVGDKSAPQQGINSNQILGPVLAKDGTLVFYDLNQGDPVILNYALHFQGNTPSVDPIVDNGGGVGGIETPPDDGGRFWGGGSADYSQMLLPLSLALIAGIVLTLIVQRFMR
jgi:hypothetical protein